MSHVPFHRRSLLTAGLGLGMAACAPKGPGTIRFWAMGREGEVAAELVKGFEQENPGLRVVVEQLPWSSAHEKLLTAFAGDATPDIAQVGNTWLPEMDALGALEPLDTLLADTPSIQSRDYFDGIWNTNRVGGRHVGIPWYVDTRLLFYRKDLLAQVGFANAPSQWADWLRCMAALKAGPVTHPILLPTNEFEPLLALALQQDEELLSNRCRYGQFSAPGFQRALRFYLSLFEQGFAPGVNNNQVANLWQEFGRGTFAFYISGPWNIGEFKRRLAPQLQNSWATAPLPGPVGPGASIAGGASLAIFKRSSVKPAAWKLVEYLNRPSVQLAFYHLTGNLPPRRTTWALPLSTGQTLAQDPYAQAFAKQLEQVKPPPAVPEWERIALEMQLFAARAIHYKTSVADTTLALDQRVDAILEKRRWMQDRGSL